MSVRPSERCLAVGLFAIAVAAVAWAEPPSAPAGLTSIPPTSPSPATGSVTDTSGVPEWASRLLPDPDSPAGKAFAAERRKQIAIKKELLQIRFKYFMTPYGETRQVGIGKIKAYTDPIAYPVLLSVFEHEEQDVRGAVLDHLADQRTESGDAALAWAAVFSTDVWERDSARARLRARVAETKSVGQRVRAVLMAGLKDSSDDPPAAAAKIASGFDLFDMIPAMVNAQVGGGAGAGGPGGGGSIAGVGGAIATIMIGTQQAFVSGLTPVVGDNAVAFDPTLSVVTSGTYIAIYGAAVVTYRTEVHDTLVGLADRGWDGRSTAGLGYNPQAWSDWYTKMFLPYRASPAAQAAQASQKAAP